VFVGVVFDFKGLMIFNSFKAFGANAAARLPVFHR